MKDVGAVQDKVEISICNRRVEGTVLTPETPTVYTMLANRKTEKRSFYDVCQDGVNELTSQSDDNALH